MFMICSQVFCDEWSQIGAGLNVLTRAPFIPNAPRALAFADQRG
jgi:hypothetical protein